MSKAPKHAAKRDTEQPCAICGWSKHMGIHTFPKTAHGKPPLYPHEYKQKAQP